MTDRQLDSSLVRLLLEQSRKLEKLGPQPLAVASARNKFNDAYEDDYWCAVQLGHFRWEQSQFFGSPDPAGFGSVNEHATMRLSRDGYASPEATASDVAAARSILKTLDQAKWHELVESACGHRSSGGILALVIQFDQVWLHCSDPSGVVDDHIFGVNDDGLVDLGYVDQRFDELVGNAELIRCEEARESALARLSPTARAQFDDLVHDQDAASKLAEVVIPIALRVDDILHASGSEGTPVALQLAVGFRNARYRPFKQGHSTVGIGGPRFAVGELYFDKNKFNTISRCANRLPKAAERLTLLRASHFLELDEYFRTLDESAVRQLFERAMGMNTFDTDDLSLIMAGPQPWLLYRSKLYPVKREGIGSAIRRSDAAAELGTDVGEWLASLHRVFRQIYEQFA